MIFIKSMANFRIYLFLLLLSIYFSGLHSSKAGFEQEQTWFSDYCTNKEFRCENGQCIAQPFVCDGILDCEDGSDETYKQCWNISCGEQYFRCDYGACINKEYQCDGREQCPDGSDESREECNELVRNKLRRIKRQSGDSCSVPALSLDRTVTYSCQPNCDVRNGFVPNMTVAIVQCKPNFYSGDDILPPSVCLSGVWRPTISNCYKKCDKLTPINVNLRCTRDGSLIPCDENSLIAGSKVRPTCVKLHKYADIVAPDYIEITCNQNGKWDRHLFNCVPECGRSYMEIPFTKTSDGFDTRISGGVEERYGDAPWHVAIYDTRQVLICGGTIIHQYLVVSAAHCFAVNDTISSPSDYEVVVSKVSRNYTIKDNDYQRVHKIREIRGSDKGYFGASNSFAADIVVLILEERIEISATVLPACINWIELSQRINPVDGTLGKVSGWGLTGVRTGGYSETLLTANLSFISHERCLRTVPDGFKDFVTFDKFCAGGEGGPIVLQGDSGGGYLLPQSDFQKQAQYFLRGIISLKDVTVTPIAAFTDLADHYEWILTTRNEVDRNITSASKKNSSGPSGESICKIYNLSNCVMIQLCSIADVLIQSKKAIYCGYDVDDPDSEKICCKLPDILQVSPAPVTTTTTTIITTTTNTPQPTASSPPTPTTAHPTTIYSPPPSTIATRLDYEPPKSRPPKTSAEIVSSYCDKYSKYATDCAIDKPPPGKRSPALLKEYPHNAYVACEDKKNHDQYWYSTGSLISEWFVLSVAFCEADDYGTAQWVHLGALNKSTTKTEDQAQIYGIERTYIHPNYSVNLHSISLYKLKNEVVFNAFIRPACLSMWQFLEVNDKFRMASWGTSNIKGSSTTNLQKGTVTLVDDEKCAGGKEYDSNSMACAGKGTDGEALCLMTTGSPLLLPMGSSSCVWSIYGMWVSRIKKISSCQDTENAEPQMFTKVAYYLEWIQKIVWPQPSSSQNGQKVPNVAVQTSPPPINVAVRTPQPPVDTPKTPAEIASSHCQKYSQYATDCVIDPPLRGKRKRALAKEFPHVAYIGCESNDPGTFLTSQGSLISEQFVLSIAVCETGIYGKAKWVHLGALIRSAIKSETHDEIYDVERTYVHPNYNFPRHSIALYKLKTPVEFNSYIRPACLYTSNYNEINSRLRIASWGTPQILNARTTDLYKGLVTVVNDDECSNVERYNSDSMTCAGESSDGEALCLLTRGSSLEVPVGNKSCVTAIYAMWVSHLALPQSCQNPGNIEPQHFTKVSYYLDWIQAIVWPTNSLKNTQKVSYVTAKSPHYGTNQTNVQTSGRSSAEIASLYCDRYSTYATDCVNDPPSRSTRERVLAKEYPHIAYVGCESDEENTYWTSVGSLISDRFVLSAAYCETGNKGKAKWVHLGALKESTVKSETYDKMYDVERSYVHPEYNFPRRSIALYKLKTTVDFNSYIRPACLYTSNTYQINKGLAMAGWGTKTIRGSNTDNMMKGVLTVVDDKKCSSVTGYDSNSMACVGDGTDGEALCLISLGTPLQVLKNNTSCVWAIYAIHYGHVTLPESCDNVGNAKPQLFTKVSYYLDWIRGIVWP